jgi:hypothetical protein
MIGVAVKPDSAAVLDLGDYAARIWAIVWTRASN